MLRLSPSYTTDTTKYQIKYSYEIMISRALLKDTKPVGVGIEIF